MIRYIFKKRAFSSTIRSITTNHFDEKYIPAHDKPQQNDIERLQEFLFNSKRLFIITGAGISTESGIPDYRSEGVGLYARTTNRPM